MLTPNDIIMMTETRMEIWREKKKTWKDTFSFFSAEPAFSVADTSQPVVPADNLNLSNISGKLSPIVKDQIPGTSLFGSMGQAKMTLEVVREDLGDVEIESGYTILDEKTNVLYRVEDALKHDYFWRLYLSEVIRHG